MSDDILARIGPAKITRPQADPIEDKTGHPRDRRENGWQPLEQVDIGDEFALCYQYDDDHDGHMYTHKAFEGYVHDVYHDGVDLFVLVRDNCCDPADQWFYVYRVTKFCSCNWNKYDDGWRDEWDPECDDKAGESFGSPIACYKGEKNVSTKWMVTND